MNGSMCRVGKKDAIIRLKSGNVQINNGGSRNHECDNHRREHSDGCEIGVEHATLCEMLCYAMLCPPQDRGQAQARRRGGCSFLLERKKTLKHAKTKNERR